MTYLSPSSTFSGSLAPNLKERSTYGKQSLHWSSCYSVQGSQRGGRLNYQNRTQVLSSQALVCQVSFKYN
jgi:hypothetical protein